MVSVYKITDCNGLNYIGSTKQKLSYRMSGHRYDRSRNNWSSSKLDLDNCEIILLEECSIENRKIREQYWIDNTKCVNFQNALGNKKQRDALRELYINTWGGNKRYENNLLRIDVKLFL